MHGSRTLKIAASVLIIGGAATYLLADTLSADPEALTYFHGADEVIADRARFDAQRIRMGGYVEEGSILQKKGTLDYQFEVGPVLAMIKRPEAIGKTITVRYSGVVPDTFQDAREVIVTGSLNAEGVFVANDLLAKCPSKYEAEAKNKGEY